MLKDVVVSIPSTMWARALEFAGQAGHDVERDVVVPAVLEYVKIQADIARRNFDRCSACNATSVDGECLECGWTAGIRG